MFVILEVFDLAGKDKDKDKDKDVHFGAVTKAQAETKQVYCES